MPPRRRLSGASSSRYPLLREVKASGVPAQMMRSAGAHSYGIGRKVVNGKTTNQLVLRFYVETKQSVERLAPEARLPSEVEFVSRGTGNAERVVTDVIESAAPIFEIDPKLRHRPAPGGVSVDAISGTAGTLGGWVWDTTDDTIVALSNHHVFGHVAGDNTIQPGPFDGGSSPADKIGDVKRGIVRTVRGPNTVDAGISDVDGDDLYDLTVAEIGPAVYAVEVPALDMLVEKFGRTTEHTFGEITDVDLVTNVSGFPFTDCMRVDVVAPSPDWSAGGDSGSLVFSQTPIGDGSTIKPVVGLHFAGPPGGTSGVACKIQNVFAQLDLTTLCAGAFATLFDSLAEVEPRSRFRTLPPFSRPKRRRGALLNPKSGLARDVQARLKASKRGRELTGFVDIHRHELLTLLATNGDVRRSTTAAFGPLLAGAVTTGDVLERSFTDEDVAQLAKLAEQVRSAASPALAKALRPILEMAENAEGKSLAQVLRMRSE